jgi:S1-C subfamily serine protease
VADSRFVDPARADYRVKEDSPALALGFVNFPMDQFGVQKGELKALARHPVFPAAASVPTSSLGRDLTAHTWLGATVRNIGTEGEMSALGLPGVYGVLVLDVTADSTLAKAGLQKRDVIFSANGSKVPSVVALVEQAPALAPLQLLTLGVFRQQKETVLNIRP